VLVRGRFNPWQCIIAADRREWPAQLGFDVGYDSVTFLFHEFWPDISYRIFGKHAATPGPGEKP
jgi:hypothetical protein